MLAGIRLISAGLLSLALSADAGLIRRDAVPVTIPFVRRMNLTGTAKIIELDQARAKTLKSRANSGFKQTAVFDVPATNQAVDYTTTVRIFSHFSLTRMLIIKM